VSLENRNAFGHALITHIAGNVGDKPVLSENSIRLGTRLTRAACDRRSGRRAGSARPCAARCVRTCVYRKLRGEQGQKEAQQSDHRRWR